MSSHADNLERFLAGLEASRLLPVGVLSKAFVAVIAAEPPPGDCEFVLRAVKQELIANGSLTAWQCDKLELGKWRGFFIDDYVLLEHVVSDHDLMTYLAKHIRDGHLRHLSVRAGTHPLQYEVKSAPT